MSDCTVQSTHPMGTDGIVRCRHGEQVDKIVSRTLQNPGREFYVCSRPQSDRCNFWYWVDDPLFKQHSPESTAAQNSGGLCTPRASPLHSTIQSTPAKRKRPENAVTSPRAAQASADTLSKKARLEAIEAGLRARLEDETPCQSLRFHQTVPEQTDTLPFTDGIDMPTPKTNADTGQQVEPPRARYSFLGLPPTQESECDAGPSTPKKRSSSPVVGKQELFGLHGATSSSALLTPPQSMKVHTNRIEPFAYAPSSSSISRAEPVTPTRHKGKERANPEWDRLVAAEEEDPFNEATTSFMSKLEHDSLQRASVDSQGPPCTPTTGERIARSIIELQDTMNTLRTHTDILDQLDAVKYIERLERQKNALKVGDEAKKKRIAALTAERDELKEKVCQLEERSRAQDKTIASLRRPG